jgi:hypothetical protein
MASTEVLYEFGPAPASPADRIACAVMNLPWAKLGLDQHDVDGLANRHGDVQNICDATLPQSGAGEPVVKAVRTDNDRLRNELRYIAKAWPDSFAARHARAALSPSPPQETTR